MTEAPGRGGGFGARYRRGLQASARDNAAAYGYSVTASFGILAAVLGTPRVAEIFAFAAGAVVGFALIEAVASGGFRHRLRDEPSDVRAIGASFSFPSVGLALAAALAAGEFAGGLPAWPLGSLLAARFPSGHGNLPAHVRPRDGHSREAAARVQGADGA